MGIQGLTEEIKKYQGQFSVLLKDLGRKEVLFAKDTDKLVRSASTIKVGILLEVMAQVKAGVLSLDQEIIIREEDKVPYSVISRMKTERMKLEDVALFMMSHSDNTATNLLIDLAGMENINRRMVDVGCKGTVLRRKMMDFEAAKRGLENVISAEDMATMLETIYRGTFLGDLSICERMKSYMSTGDSREFMDRYLPEEVCVLHKTGELDHLDHDGGVVYLGDYIRAYRQGTESYELLKAGETGDYLLVILGEGFSDNPSGRETISRLSQWVYEKALAGWR